MIQLGSQWFIFKKDHVDIICKNATEEFKNKFKYTACADEHFFQILFKKNILPSEYDKKNLRYIDFISNESSPRFLDEKDIDMLLKEDEIFIARKIKLELLKKYFRDGL